MCVELRELRSNGAIRISVSGKSTFDTHIIILGDAGINFSGAEYDSRKKGMLASLPITIMALWTLSYRKEN